MYFAVLLTILLVSSHLLSLFLSLSKQQLSPSYRLIF